MNPLKPLHSGAKSIARQVLYRGRILSTYHKIRNRRALTVVMFHRVLPKTDPRNMTADPEWTVSTEFFEDCLRFFASHYSVVDVADVLASIQGKRLLPRRPLLITIDD